MNLKELWVYVSSEARLEIFLCSILLIIYLVAYIFYPTPQKEIQPSLSPLQISISSEEIWHIPTKSKEIVFTFDAGSGLGSLYKILGVLDKHKVKGTFFITGKFIEDYPEAIRKIRAGGHEMFNHSYDHPRFTEISDAEVVSQLQKTDRLLNTVANLSSKPFFRPPFGDRDERVLKTAFDAGFESIYWTVDAGDWMEGELEAEDVKNRIYSGVAPGAIVLMHIGDKITGDILDEVFTEIEQKGYRLLSLSEALSSVPGFASSKK